MTDMDKRPNRIGHFSILKIDKLIHSLHTQRRRMNKFVYILICLSVYILFFLLFTDKVGVSINYIIIVPMIAVTFSFGFIGGLASGVLGLPLNLLMLHFLGHPEYAPDSKIIAEIFGIVVGSVLGYLSDYYYDIETEIRRRREAEEELQKTVEEKEMLLHEIHHRVKNNLNIVRSLIQLQINRSRSSVFRTEAQKLIGRIYSISRVHEQLYKSNKTADTGLDKYIPKLVDDILCGIDEGCIEVGYDIVSSNLSLDIEKATSVGLIINEVITNAVKYSLPLVTNPEIHVRVRESSGSVVIELSNNAPTFIPEGDDNQGLGLKLIKTLSEQLSAEYEWVPENGTTFRLSFPV